jgi:ornithine decarboxylase
MKDEDEQQQKLGTSVIRKSLLTHALLKGAVDDDDGEQSDDERGEEKPMKIEDMDEEDQPEYSMTEIKTVLEEAVEDIEESGIFDDLAENIEEIVRVGSFKERASSMDERREMFSSSMPKTPRGGVNITSSVSMEENNEDSEKENIGGGGGGGGRSSGSYRRKKAEFLSKEVMESLRERREQNEVAPPVLITEEQLETAFEVINSLETYVEAGEADPDFVEQFVPEELAVIVKGLAETAGFEETLLDDTQQEPVDFEEAVPEELNFEEIRKTFDVHPIASRSMDDVRERCLKLVNDMRLEDTFAVIDLHAVVKLYEHLKKRMPRVTPHYAVKCCPDRGIISTLAALGAGFDCASQGEVELIKELGIDVDKIILAHAVKRPVDLRCIAEHGVKFTTFDSESELHKMFAARLHECKLVLRIKADDPMAKISFGAKFGAHMDDVPKLLSTAQLLGMDIVGVSFHVGSSSRNPNAYRNAIQHAKDVFQQGYHYGFKMNLLDLGGGYTGLFDQTGNIDESPCDFSIISKALDDIFPKEQWPKLKIIAEPGRYFAQSPITIASMVYGKRETVKASGDSRYDYYITDGLYGCFNGVIYDGLETPAYILKSTGDGSMPELELRLGLQYESTIWGPTCDSADCVMRDTMMTELNNGDYILFPDSGAYTLAGSCDFNGIEATKARKFYVWGERMCPTCTVEQLDSELFLPLKPPCELVQHIKPETRAPVDDGDAAVE